jgi:hypothetical protein
VDLPSPSSESSCVAGEAEARAPEKPGRAFAHRGCSYRGQAHSHTHPVAPHPSKSRQVAPQTDPNGTQTTLGPLLQRKGKFGKLLETMRISGATDRIRTDDLLITNYVASMSLFVPSRCRAFQVLPVTVDMSEVAE